MQEIKIYCLIDPRNGSPFYVGATNGRLKTRLSAHVGTYSTGRGVLAQKYRLIQEIIKSGEYPKIKLIRLVPYDRVDHYESFYCRKFLRKGFKLLQDLNKITYQKQITHMSLEKRRKTFGHYLDNVDLDSDCEYDTCRFPLSNQ